MDELLLLMDVQKFCKGKRYEALNLESFFDLKIEVERRINKLKRDK
jgi:hypothetical protein